MKLKKSSVQDLTWETKLLAEKSKNRCPHCWHWMNN